MKRIFKRFGFVDYALLAMLAVAILLAVLRLKGIVPVSSGWSAGLIFFVAIFALLRNHVSTMPRNKDEQLSQRGRGSSRGHGRYSREFEKSPRNLSSAFRRETAKE